MTSPVDTTFCFTDIAGSTDLLRRLGDAAYQEILERHRTLIRAALAEAGGEEVGVEGDGFLLAFASADAAVRFTLQAQQALLREVWPHAGQVLVRMGMHRGPASRRPDGDYVALAVHRASRVAAAAYGGQILLTAQVAEAISASPAGALLTPLGQYLLRDFDGPVEISQLHGPGLATAFPQIRATRAAHGLPLPPTSLVGRTQELRRLRETIAAGQLLSVVGPGGVGKSRLCLEAAAELAARFPDGMHVLELSMVGDEDLLSTATAALGVRPFPGQEPLDALAPALQGQRLLLLDSCERCLDAVAPFVKELLDRCPGLAVVATSTEAIRIPGEIIVMLEPLTVPAEGSDDELASAPALQLLLQRVIAGGGTLDPVDDAAALAVIARRLDGMPLALELAAGRITEVGLPAVVQGLEDRFSLLTNGFRTALPRHRTLEAMAAWAVEMLEPVDRDLFERLSCLRGRWAASAVPHALGLSSEAQIGLRRLADRSLIRLEGDDSRVRLLDTLRLYGQRTIHGEVAGVVARSVCAYICRLIVPVPRISVPDPSLMHELDWIAPDVDATLASPPAGQEVDLALAAPFLAAWFELRGSWQRGQDSLLQLAQACPPGRARASALVAAATLDVQMGRHAAAVELAEQALEQPEIDDAIRACAYMHLSLLQPELPDGTDPLVAALALVTDADVGLGLSIRARLAHRRAMQGDAAGAAEDFVQIEADARAAQMWVNVIQAALNQGGCRMQAGQAEEAERCLARGRDLAREHGHPLVEGVALGNLAILTLQRGDPDRAVELAEERVALAERTGELMGQASALSVIAMAAQMSGQHELARSTAVRTLELYERVRRPDGMVVALLNLTIIDSAQDLHAAGRHAERAITASYGDPGPVSALVALAASAGVACLSGADQGPRLLGAYEALSAGPPPVALPLDPSDRAWLERAEAAAVLALGAPAVASGRAEGVGLDLDAARALAEAAMRGVVSSDLQRSS